MFIDKAFEGASNHLMALALPSSRIYFLYLAAAFVLATLSFLYYSLFADETARPERIRKGWLGYIFDRSVFLHPSAKQDYLYFLVNAFVYYGIISQLMIGAHVMYGGFLVMLNGAFGQLAEPLFAASVISVVLYTLVVALLFDFAVFITHYLQHRVPVLWQFHMVHHSAETLTPMTLFRMHPVDLFFTGLTAAVLGALALAVFAYLTGEAPRQIMVLNVNVVVFAFYLFGYNLRHSHIWFSYPAWLSHLLVSPAQHQIHHSVAPKHFDRNFGLIFSFWDWLFGTLYVPRRYEKLEYGINRAEPNPFPTVSSLYLDPFRRAWALIAPEGSAAGRRLALGAGLMVTATLGIGVLSADSTRSGYVPPDLQVENLTWTEIGKAVEAGYTRIIVPTGGVEQNGAHVVTGKHNHVVRHTAERIAAELGDTLVAPLITYVPEGEPGDAPTGHMRYPGTLTVPGPVFEALLAAAVESYATHGFTAVYLIGDSGGNQDGQARVAESFARRGGPVRVHHVDAYYSGNGQVAWLEQQGFGKAEIGGHAGIRDTSELLAVFPEGVRQDYLVPPPDGPLGSGSSGDWRKASAEIGRKMIDLKVDAALRQIRALDEAAGQVN